MKYIQGMIQYIALTLVAIKLLKFDHNEKPHKVIKLKKLYVINLYNVHSHMLYENRF